MNDLDGLLVALAEEETSDEAPPAVHGAVMQAWDAMHRRVPSRHRWRGTAAALVAIGSLAAAIVAMVISGVPSIPASRPEPMVPPATEQPRAVVQEPAPAGETPVTTLPPRPPRPPGRANPARSRYDVGVVLVADPIVDASAMSIVRVRVPSAALVTLGIPLVEPNDGGAVDLEMLVGEDGVARTIRRAVPVVVRQE